MREGSTGREGLRFMSLCIDAVMKSEGMGGSGTFCRSRKL